MKVSGIRVEIDNDDHASAIFESERSIYRIRFNPQTMKRDGWLYQKPKPRMIEGMEIRYRAPNRRLDATNKTNTPVVDHVFAEIIRLKLVQKGINDLTKARAERESVRQAAERLYRVRVAGPRLLGALQEIIENAGGNPEFLVFENIARNAVQSIGDLELQ